MSQTAHTELLEKLLPTLTAVDATTEWHIRGPAVRARKCDIYKVTNTTRTLALKVYKPVVASDIAPSLQHRALVRCNQAVNHQPLLRAPTALAFLPDEGAILMDWQSAPTLRSVLWKKFTTPYQRLELVTAAAKWLRAFHELSDIVSAPTNGGKLTAKLNTQMTRLPGAPALLEQDPAFHKVLNRFFDAATDILDNAPHALLHGDYTPTNLLVDDAGIIGMDMWGARRGPVYEDIARMLAYLGIVSPFALWREPLNPDSALIQAFARGYGDDLFDLRSAQLPMVLLYQQLRRWLVYAGKNNRQPFSPLVKWQLTRNRSLCRQTLTWLDHCKP